jgi:hypothetical protein
LQAPERRRLSSFQSCGPTQSTTWWSTRMSVQRLGRQKKNPPVKAGFHKTVQPFVCFVASSAYIARRLSADDLPERRSATIS